MDLGKLISNFLKWRVRHVNEHRFIIFLSIFLGIQIGIIVAILKSLIYFIKDLINSEPLSNLVNYFNFVLPILGVTLTLLIVKWFAGGKLNRGIPFVLYVIGRNAGIMRSGHMYMQAITSALTIGFGGSVGLESPGVVTGAAWGSNYGRFFHLNSRQTTILIGCGAAAAIASIFNAPIAGVIFVLEVLLVNVNISFIIPLLIASVSGTMVSQLLMGEQALFNFSNLEPVGNIDLLFFVGLGLACGFLSVYFIRAIYVVENKLKSLKNNKQRVAVAGVCLGMLIWIFPTLYGEGYWSVTKLIIGQPSELLEGSLFRQWENTEWFILLFLFASMMLKVFATGLTTAAGGVGGVFAPSMFVGGICGYLFARIFNLLEAGFVLSEINFTLVGMAGVAAGIMHSPLTNIFLIAEITKGYELFVPLMIVAAVSYAVKLYFEPHSYFTKELAKRGDYIVHDKDKTVLQDINITKVIERNFVTINEAGKLRDLVEAISRSDRNLFPVVNDAGELKGIILLNDVRKVIFKPELYDEEEIKYIMHAPPDVVDINEPMESVMDKFDQTNAWNLPVLEGGKYAGFLSKSKIFSMYRRQLKRQARELGQFV